MRIVDAVRRASRGRTVRKHGELRGAVVLRFGACAIDVSRREVRRHDAVVHLTPKAFDLLALLVRNAGRVLTHRQILTAVWGPAHTEDLQYLRVFIGQLRQKLEATPDTPQLILTEPGIGYRLQAGLADT